MLVLEGEKVPDALPEPLVVPEALNVPLTVEVDEPLADADDDDVGVGGAEAVEDELAVELGVSVAEPDDDPLALPVGVTLPDADAEDVGV